MKKLFTVLLMMLFAVGQLAAQAPNIILITPDDRDDAQYEFLMRQGFNVEKFWPGDAISAAGQDTIDFLNAADLIIHGRSPNSGTTDSPDKEVWNALTAPMIVNSQWVARSSRMNMFNSTSAYHQDELPVVAFGAITDPADPIFEFVDGIDGDSLDWCYPPHDFIQNADSATNGTILVTYDGTSPLVVRFDAGVEYYPGAVDMPAGPRTYWGMGNDNAGWANFFPLTKAAKAAYLGEICRLMGIPVQEPVFGPEDIRILLISPDERDDAQLNWLQLQGFDARVFYPGDAISAAGQDTIDMLNAADLIIHGRSPNSGTTDSPDKEVWNALTAPMIVNSQWVARSSRMNMFKSTSAYHQDEAPAVAYAAVLDPADAIFNGLTLEGDSVGWCLPPHDFLENNDSATNGTILAVYNETSPLVVRFDAGVEYYPGAVDMPAGPRTYWGMGNDNAGWANFFPLTREAKQAYLAEISRLVGIDAPAETKYAPADYSITFITDDDQDDPQINWLEKNGVRVNKFYPGALSAAGQDTIDMLNMADLVIVGRSPNSGDFDAPDKEVWNALTVPLIINSQWVARSSRINMFNSTSAYHMDDGPEVAYAATMMPDDPVFSMVTLMEGDSVAFCLPPHDFLENNDSATNGEIVAYYNMTSPLLTRFEAGTEYYPGAVDMPAGPRTYFGIGNDNGGFPNFFPLTPQGQQIYLNEISLMLGAEMVEVVTVSSDASLASLDYDVATATLTPAFDPDSMSYMLELVQDSNVVVLSGTPANEFAMVEVDTVDVTSGDTITGTVVVIAENGNQMEYDVEVYPFISDVSVQPNEVEGPGIKLYPNPASDMIYIEAGAEISQVTVYNAVGRVVMDQTYRNNPRVDLNVGSLIPGLYMIKVDFDKDQSTMVKLLKR